jgi:hypothetical protein
LAVTVFEKDINKMAIGQSVLAYKTKKYACEII